MPNPSRLLWTLAAAMLAAMLQARQPLPKPALDLKICQVQGSGATTPHAGQQVRTRGVVTLDFDSRYQQGFYLQDPNCDGNAATSDGIFIYLDQKLDLVSLGDDVEVTGTALEFAGLTEIAASVQDITIHGSTSLPAPDPFSPPWGAVSSAAYFESHEGMRVGMAAAVVVGPTSARGETFVLDAAHGVGRVFQGNPAGTIVRVGQGGPNKIIPDAAVGDSISGLSGVLDFSLGTFRLQLDAPPFLAPGPGPQPQILPASSLTFATLNLHNLFDTFDDPATQDPVLSPTAYQTRLQKLAGVIADELGEPDFIALQETENIAVLQALANRPEISVQYFFTSFEGPDVRGIDSALFYRSDRAQLISSEPRQGCTGLVDGLGPDGNQNVLNPQNALTCDLDGLPGWEGNRLFSRPPLLVRLKACSPNCSPGAAVRELWVIVVHLKSKSQDTATVAYTLPRRVHQAQFLTALVQEIQSADPAAEIAVLGDFNDYPTSQPLLILEAAGMVNLMRGFPGPWRYTFIYQGVSQVLDHVLVNQQMVSDPLVGLAATPIHVAADFPASMESDPSTHLGASDHDPVLISEIVYNRQVFLPLIP